MVFRLFFSMFAILIEANHNKDYSVVKTFRAGIRIIFLSFLFFIPLRIRPEKKCFEYYFAGITIHFSIFRVLALKFTLILNNLRLAVAKGKA